MAKLKLFLFFLLMGFSRGTAQSLYFPPLVGNTWDTLAPASLGWCQQRIDSLYNYLQVKNTKSFIVLKHGKIVLENYFGTYTADSVFYWASSSKSLAGFITGMAQQKGFININNPVSQYLGAGWTIAPTNKENLITVKDLLKMTSGLDDSPPTPCDNEDTAKACLLYLADAGTRWAYHTGAYRMVQDVVSSATGLNYNVLTNQWVENKTGMSGFWLAQVYYSKARDMARFGLLALGNGIWAGDTLLGDTSYFNAMTATSQTMNPSYGYLWWLNGKSSYLNPGLQFSFNGPLVPNAAADMYCALGKNDQKIYVVPSQGLVVIRQGNSAEGVTFALSDFDNKLWDYINKLNCSLNALDNETMTEIRLYPNPSTGKIHLASEVQIASITLTNLYGQAIATGWDGKTIDVSQLAKGTYLLQLSFTDGRRGFKKLLLE